MPTRNQFSWEEDFIAALRDWFAGQALSSAMAQYGPEKAAEMAFAYADAMIAAREVAK